MSESPVIITPKLIRRHNWRCFGRSVLWGLGSAAIFLVIFLFFWVLAGMVTESGRLTWPIALGTTILTLAVYAVGFLHLKKHGPQDWERIAQKPDRVPGMRLARMSGQEYGQVGQGFIALILSGPNWLGRIREELQSLIPANEESARELELLRQHLAAREGWMPMRDFPTHEKKIYVLTKLNILAIREMLGEWHFHTTVQGTVNRSTAVELDT